MLNLSDTILWPFTINNIGVLNTTSNIEEAINSLLTFIFSIRENEILGDPNLCSKLHLLLFETDKNILDTMSSLYIEEAINEFASDFVRFKSCIGSFDNNNKIYNIEIIYEIKSTNEEKVLNYSLEILY
ncbi:MAG: hypothetical protein JG780_29 [Thermosipho sp. (in: Bacteria)]|nr:hypothetical protein [Thermosipho sp. (in: thermotogales)]